MRKIIKSGIQKRYLKYTAGLLILALCLSSLCVWVYMRDSVTKTLVDKYNFVDEKMGLALDNLYQKSDEVMAECIVYEDVQESLRKKPMEEVNRNSLSKYFAYIDLEGISEYCYVDNKQNVYSRFYSDITYSDFSNSGFEALLGGEYSSTKWIWTKDTLFGTE